MRPDPRRWGAAAAALVVLSVSGHVSGGGGSPHPVAVGFVSILALLVAALLSVACRPWRVRRLLPILGLFQVAAHAILHSVTGAGPVPVHALVAPHHGHLGASAPIDAVRVVDVAHVQTGGHGLSPLMLTTHLLATVVLAWVLGPAERQLRSLLTRACPQVRHVDLRPHRIPLTRVVAIVTRPVGTTASLRGPPRFVTT